MQVFFRGRSLLVIALILVSASACDDSAAPENETRDIVADLLTDIEPEALEEQELYENQGFIPESARDDQLEALERANWFRWQSGLPHLDMIPQINDACQSHCDYYVLHFDEYQSSGYSPHNENPAWSEGFSGSAPWDRMGFFGYDDGASEVIAFIHNATQSVDGWMNTLYHRIPFMDATMTGCGYGAAGTGSWANSTRIDTMDFGTTNARGDRYSGPVLEGIYPPPGSSGIPPSFDGLESPQPPPPPDGYPSGTIVSVTWSDGASFKADEHRIWKDGEDVGLPHTWLDAFNDSHLQGAGTIALYTDTPLEYGTRYWVHIKGTKSGKDWEKEWFFITARYPN